jgi:hypothetical protein
MVSSGLLRRVALVRTDVSEEPGASFIRVTKIGELGTTDPVSETLCFLFVEILIIIIPQLIKDDNKNELMWFILYLIYFCL